MREYPIGVFDSGVGGLNVLKECVRLMPDERFVYIADEANMPYGVKPVAEIKRAATEVCDILFAMNCKAVVAACNTATVTAVDDIRRLYPTRTVIGLEPAVKPCFRELGKNGYAVALVTEATYSSDKLARLIDTCEGRIIPVSRPELAGLIEKNADDIDNIVPHINGILKPYEDAEAVILGCSHYTYIAPAIKNFYRGNIKIYDGATGAAERLKYCLTISDMLAQCGNGGGVRFYSTFSRLPNFRTGC